MTISLTHVLVCGANPRAGIPAGLAFSRAIIMEAHFVAAGRFAINLPDAEPAPEKGVGWAASPSTGLRLQFFGSEQSLHMIRTALAPLVGMFGVGDVEQVRDPVGHICCRRERDAVRTPATVAREIRRAERKAAEKSTRITEQLRRNLQASQRKSRLPYLSLASLSTGNTFAARFEIQAADAAVAGEFDSYGFGKAGATVPMLPVPAKADVAAAG